MGNLLRICVENQLPTQVRIPFFPLSFNGKGTYAFNLEIISADTFLDDILVLGRNKIKFSLTYVGWNLFIKNQYYLLNLQNSSQRNIRLYNVYRPGIKNNRI